MPREVKSRRGPLPAMRSVTLKGPGSEAWLGRDAAGRWAQQYSGLSLHTPSPLAVLWKVHRFLSSSRKTLD